MHFLNHVLTEVILKELPCKFLIEEVHFYMQKKDVKKHVTFRMPQSLYEAVEEVTKMAKQTQPNATKSETINMLIAIALRQKQFKKATKPVKKVEIDAKQGQKIIDSLNDINAEMAKLLENSALAGNNINQASKYINSSLKNNKNIDDGKLLATFGEVKGYQEATYANLAEVREEVAKLCLQLLP